MKPPVTGRPSGWICSFSSFARMTFSRRRELRVAQIHALLQRGQHGGEIGDLGTYALAVRLGATARRIPAEVEFTVIDVSHLGEALAQRVEPDDVGIHFAEAHGHGVDALPAIGS